ncbi:hypothetical protein DW125_02820 [Dorea sp. AM10-31]|nr:hypothetical protein DW125_02820 [Dorea sp. AM10-31]
MNFHAYIKNKGAGLRGYIVYPWSPASLLLFFALGICSWLVEVSLFGFSFPGRYAFSFLLYTDYNSPYMYARPILNPSSFTWTSSNKDIATVNKNGIVKKGSKTGKVKITAKLKTGTKVSFSKILTVK